MRAIVQDRYGPPSELRLAEVDEPRAGDGEVLVRVRAASVNALDWRLARGEPFVLRFAFGLRKPKHRIPGADAAGVVEAVGAGVTDLAAGDEVYADLSGAGFGAFAELVAAPAAAWARKPRSLTFEEAAAMPVAAVTALQGLRDEGRVAPGAKVLVNGASGGVGTFAVQVASALGADVTAVCSTGNVDQARRLGASRVIDYKREDPTKTEERYDVVLDCAAHRPVRAYSPILAEGGRYVLVGGSFGPTFQAMALGPLLSRGGRKFSALSAKPRREDLGTITKLVEEGSLRPVIERRRTLAEVPAAVAHVDAGHAQGKTVIAI